MDDHTGIKVALAAAAIGMALLAGTLLAHDGDITGLMKFGSGDDAVPITEHAEARIGREVATVDALGHDGKYFFLQALDPFYLSPEEHAPLLDRPVYRGQRMLLPTLASVGGSLPAAAVPWGFAVVNIGALVLGALGTRRLALGQGASGWWGLAFPLNVGIVFEFDIAGAGVLAFACAIWGTAALQAREDRAAALWFTAAVLAREVMLLYVAGALLLRLVRTRRVPWLVGLPPVLAVAAWAGYLRLRLDSGTGVDEVQEFGPPLAGALDALPNWIDNPVDLLVIAVFVAMIPVLAWHAVRTPSELSWGALGFAVLALFFSRQVWWRFFDITRAAAPVITACIVVAFARPRPPDDGGPGRPLPAAGALVDQPA